MLEFPVFELPWIAINRIIRMVGIYGIWELPWFVINRNRRIAGVYEVFDIPCLQFIKLT